MQTYMLFLVGGLVVTLASGVRWCCHQPKTFDEKVQKLLAYTDYNNDSIITTQDIIHNIMHNLNSNNDNKTTKVEYVVRRECLFGDDIGFSLFEFRNIDANHDGVITAADFDALIKSNFTATVAQFKQGIGARYGQYISGTVIG